MDQRRDRRGRAEGSPALAAEEARGHAGGAGRCCTRRVRWLPGWSAATRPISRSCIRSAGPAAGIASGRRSWRGSRRWPRTPRSISTRRWSGCARRRGVSRSLSGPTAAQRPRQRPPRGLRSFRGRLGTGGDPERHRSQGAHWEYWNKIGMTIWASTDGSEAGRVAFHDWSAKSPKYDLADHRGSLAALFQIAADRARLRLAGLPGSSARSRAGATKTRQAPPPRRPR